MKSNTYLFYFVLSLTCIYQCKKDDKPIDILQKNNWQITSEIVTPAVDINGTKYSELISLLLPCAKDNYIQFKSDKTLITDEGATKCNAADPQTKSSGTWDLSADAKSLYLTNTDLSNLTGTLQAQVNKLDGSELNITVTNVTFLTNKVSLTLKLIPK